MKIIDCQQRSDEWYHIRMGRITASHFSDVMNKKTGRDTYMMRLLAERVTGIRMESYQNKYMEDGIENEPQAREYYSWVTSNEVNEVGFVEMDKDVGCSPDGLIGTDGLIEIKCPIVTTHLKYIIKNALPPEYKPQIQGQMWICKRKWCDFVSFSPEYLKQPMFSIRVERDVEYIRMLSAATATFVTDLKELEKKL